MSNIDNLCSYKISRRMASVPSKNTRPELVIRKALFAMGYRYRLHRADLPGKPDIVFVKKKKIIFVHGCFWHVHGCKRSSTPQSNVDFWVQKLRKNQDRDCRNQNQIKAMGWRYFIVWECQLKDISKLQNDLILFLEE